MQQETFNILQTVPAIITSIGVIVGFYIAYRQLRSSARQHRLEKKAAQGNFLLEFDKMLDRYEHIHKKLRPGGAWFGEEIELEPDEWAEIERYMGLFERIAILIDDNFIDIETFDRLYGYRIRNIKNNPTIKLEKLEKRAYGWKDFIELSNAMEKARNQVK